MLTDAPRAKVPNSTKEREQRCDVKGTFVLSRNISSRGCIALADWAG